jgi:hypothetical protein
MSSSRRGGTNKLLNYAEVERRCTLVTRISHMRQRELRNIEVRLLFILHAQKNIFNSIFSMWTFYAGKQLPWNRHTRGTCIAWGRKFTWSTSY